MGKNFYFCTKSSRAEKTDTKITKDKQPLKVSKSLVIASPCRHCGLDPQSH